MQKLIEGQDPKDDRSRAIERACDYASDCFKIRIAQVDALRNRSLVALGLMSGSAAVLAANGVVERLSPIIWLPGVLFAGALLLALPPLLSVRVVHPVKLKTLHSNIDTYSATQIDEALLRDTAKADELGQRLADATALYTNNSLRLAALGLSIFMAPVLLPYADAVAAGWLGLVAGLVILGLVEMSRRAIRLSNSTE